MYNEEMKSKFICGFSTSESRRHAAVVMFNAIEPYEKRWGADICTRTKEDLEPVVSEITGLRQNSKKLRMSILQAYIKWCVKNNITGVREDIFLIESNQLSVEKIKKQTVANPQHLQMYLDYVFEAESEKTVACIYRGYYWLAYSGMAQKHVLNVRKEDVDLKDMLIRYQNREYPVYREAVRAFDDCMHLDKFKFIHPNFSDKEIYKERPESDKLLQGTGKSESIKAFRVEVSRREKNPRGKIAVGNKQTDLNLSFFRVWLSGLFYRTYEAERVGMPVDFMAAAEEFMEGKTYKLDSGRNLIGAKQRQLASDYLEDYNRWKEAYSI